MEILDIILNFDEYLKAIVDLFGPYTYLLLFGIVFAETGLVIAPFLPGDYLLFVAGTLAGTGHLNIFIIYFSLIFAAILGDTVNYWLGSKLGPRVFNKENSRIFNKAYLEKTREFYAKHGGKTIILARFFPILRTFAPFVAGIGKMHYRTFLFYNVFGAFLWVTIWGLGGYFFGALPIVQENFELVVVGSIVITLVPIVIEYIKARKGPKLTEKQLEHATYQDIQQTLKRKNLTTSIFLLLKNCFPVQKNCMIFLCLSRLHLLLFHQKKKLHHVTNTIFPMVTL